MGESLLVEIIFDMQYTEIKYFVTIVHVVNTKQNVILISIVRNVSTMICYPIR